MASPRTGSYSRLAPGLLLAGPQLGDPNFARSVVLLGKHDEDGALGWVVNGRALAPVGELLRGAELVGAGDALPATAAFQRAARVGGPVQPASGYLVYRRVPGVEVTSEVSIGEHLGVCSDPEVLRAVVRGEVLPDFLLLLGYAGWGPGQLEAEIRAGAWLPAPLDEELVLAEDLESLWDRAYRKSIGLGAGAFTATRGGSA